MLVQAFSLDDPCFLSALSSDRRDFSSLRKNVREGTSKLRSKVVCIANCFLVFFFLGRIVKKQAGCGGGCKMVI